MILLFRLTMPRTNSWNGRWSGESREHLLTRSLTGKLGISRAKELLEKAYFTYDFGDGWRAGIEVSEVDSSKAARARKMSAGFCGYDWMVDSLIDFGQILDKQQREEPRHETT